MRLVARQGCDALHKIEDTLRGTALLRQHRVDYFGHLGLGEAAATQELGGPPMQSSSLCATIRSRATLMPLTKGIGDELAKFSSAGAAS